LSERSGDPELVEGRLFFQQLFANPVSGFFAWDVIVSAVVLWAFVLMRAATPASGTSGRRLPPAWRWACP